MISLEKYVESMKEGQEDIYFLGGENKEALLASPLIERLKRKGYDVLLFTNPMDEYVSLHMGKFDGKYKLTDVSKEGKWNIVFGTDSLKVLSWTRATRKSKKATSKSSSL